MGHADASGITKELRLLEEIKIVEREVMSDERNIVVYRLTEHGASIRMLIQSVIDWGLKHREVVLGLTDKTRA